MPHRKPKNSQGNPSQPVSASTESLSAGQLEMRIPARAEWVRVVRLATAGVASRAGFAYDDIEDIKLAVAEACNNAILHSVGLSARDLQARGEEDAEASADISMPTVTIRWRLVENGICISVSDEGRLAPPGILRKAPSAGIPLDELPESGMGLLLIESLMDEVEHESGLDADTTIHMTKRVPERSTTAHNVAAQGSATLARPDPDAPVEIGSRPVKPDEAKRPATPRSR